MRAFHYVLGEVLFLLHEGDPPLGCTYLAGDEVLGAELEEVALGVVARVRCKHLEACGCGVDQIEEVLALSVAVVVLCGEGGDYGAGVVLEELCPVHGALVLLAAVFPEEEVVLQAHGHGHAHGEDTAVVAVVHHADALDGVVVEDEVVDLGVLAGIDAEERTHSVIDGVVDELERSEVDGLADVEHVAAASEDVVDVAGVEAELADGGHGVVVAVIEQTALVVCDAAVDELDASEGRGGAGSLVDDPAPVAETGEGDALEIEALACVVEAVERERTVHHGAVAVCGEFTYEGEAGGRDDGTEGVGGAAVCEVVGTAGLGCGHELLGSGDGGVGGTVGDGPGVHCSAGCAEVVEHELVLGGRLEAAHGRCGCGSLCVGKVELDCIAAGHGTGGDVGDFLIVGRFGRPLEGNRSGGPAGDLEEEIVLDRVGLEGTVIDRPVGGAAALCEGLYLEEVLLVRGEAGGVGNLGGLESGVEGLFGHRLVGTDDEVVLLGVLVDVPFESDVVAGSHVHPCAEVLRLEAAGEVELGHFLEFSLRAPCEKRERGDCRCGCFQYILVIHNASVLRVKCCRNRSHS